MAHFLLYSQEGQWDKFDGRVFVTVITQSVTEAGLIKISLLLDTDLSLVRILTPQCSTSLSFKTGLFPFIWKPQ